VFTRSVLSVLKVIAETNYQEMMCHVQCVEMSSRFLRMELLVCQSEHIVRSQHLQKCVKCVCVTSEVYQRLSTAEIVVRNCVEIVAIHIGK